MQLKKRLQRELLLLTFARHENLPIFYGTYKPADDKETVFVMQSQKGALPLTEYLTSSQPDVRLRFELGRQLLAVVCPT